MKTSRGIQIAIGVLLLIGIGYWVQQATIARQHEQELLAGKAFFEELCKKEAGEFIYKTVENVEGIFQIRPRDGSKDYFDRLRAKDYPEDPYGHTNWEANNPETLFVSPPYRNFRFFENPLSSGNDRPFASTVPTVLGTQEPNAKYRRYYAGDYRVGSPMKLEQVTTLKSRYGYTWRGIERAEFQRFNIRGGEIIVLDLRTKEVLAVKRGFINFQTRGICQADKTDEFIYTFVSKVLKPIPPAEKTGG